MFTVPDSYNAQQRSLADRFRGQLQSTATTLQANALVAQSDARSIPVPRCPKGAQEAARKRAAARKQYRQHARQTLWKRASAANPMGLGVIELAVLNWVIGQLLRWILDQWAGDDDEDN